jgi:GNAT superfamily N-acetyltransferase
MSLTLRPGTEFDAGSCGAICYQAFKSIADAHNFPPDVPSVEAGTGILSMLLAHPGFYSVVAVLDGRIAGSNFLDERSTVCGVGPITVDPSIQNRQVGRRLMQDVMDRAAQRNFPGIRLLQAAYHNRSLCLYTKLGFDTREPISVFQGPALSLQIPGIHVRQAHDADLGACNRLCRNVHGHDRAGELQDAIKQGTASVAERNGRIAGYTTSVAFFGHTVGETNDDVKALIGAATEFPGPGFHVPTRNGDLFRFCLDHGLRLVMPMTLMTIGLYNEPSGAWLPSILY